MGLPIDRTFVDGDGDPLHVVALSTIDGGMAEMVDGRLVRVYLVFKKGNSAMHTLSMVLIMLVTVLPFAARVHYHHPIAHDDESILAYQVRSVDIPVLDNDIGPGPESLRVVAVSGVKGGKAEIIDGRTVRVTIDWASYAVWSSTSVPTGRVAHGVYIVSNGYAQSLGTWTVWYWPEMKV